MTDEDYMSDSLLLDVRPGLTFNYRQKRNLKLHKKQLQSLLQKPKTYNKEEDKVRQHGLNTEISQENKGFQLLTKMGFRPGAGLGKCEDGPKEPIGFTVKSGNAGVGLETHVSAINKRKEQAIETMMRQQERSFKAANFEKRVLRVLREDFLKAQHICEELDSRKGIGEPVEEYFWPIEIMKRLHQKEQENQEENHNEVDVSQEKLTKILNYLRQTHFYCLYCMYCASSVEDLVSFCPGVNRTDHDCDEM